MNVIIDGKDSFACNVDEIKQAWKILSDSYRWAQQNIARNFYVGQRVSFDSRKRGVKVFGRITRINTKTISLRAEEGMGNWKVSPDYLKPEEGKDADVKRIRIV